MHCIGMLELQILCMQSIQTAALRSLNFLFPHPFQHNAGDSVVVLMYIVNIYKYSYTLHTCVPLDTFDVQIASHAQHSLLCVLAPSQFTIHKSMVIDLKGKSK